MSTVSQPRRPSPSAQLPPTDDDDGLGPCAATASFLLYALDREILVLHHGSLAIEKRFSLHRQPVRWIQVDNVSDSAGRLAVSYDAGNTAIVWDIWTGAELSRFSSYDRLRAASFMRNGNLAFGNDQGNIILFEHASAEHIAVRTIYDPIAALAPAADCRTFAIGYLNGSILVATVQPFAIVHTLNLNRPPGRIAGLAWHGSSSRQKTEMLATHTADGDLRVWSLPKAPSSDPPTVIRMLQLGDASGARGDCWMNWSKNGRIVQHVAGHTRAWDVRTKKVTWVTLQTPEGLSAMANYGPSSMLFAIRGRDGLVQQYDVNDPALVKSVSSFDNPTTPPITSLPRYSETESSADEALSPRKRYGNTLESELRDRLGPLSPVSSQASSVSSRSSRGNRRVRRYLYDRPDTASSVRNGTEFSFGDAPPESRVLSPFQQKSVSHRPAKPAELFPSAIARLLSTPLRTPHFGNYPPTPELLQREMLSVVFGWNDDLHSLVRNEFDLCPADSVNRITLGMWLGEREIKQASDMLSMNPYDWIHLALNAVGPENQKRVSQSFVQQLLERRQAHLAAALLLDLGEVNEAIEVYASQELWMEALLLTGLLCPSDWVRQSHLIRKWGETAVRKGQTELAVRCFSCTSIEAAAPWSPPANVPHPPNSPPASAGAERLKVKNASLKLITAFDEQPSLSQIAATPIAESALSPGGLNSWRLQPRTVRDPSSARTVTPGGASRQKRLPSRNRTGPDDRQTPMTARVPSSRPRDNRVRDPSSSSRNSSPETDERWTSFPMSASRRKPSREPAFSESNPFVGEGDIEQVDSRTRNRTRQKDTQRAKARLAQRNDTPVDSPTRHVLTAKRTAAPAQITVDDENFYKLASPAPSQRSEPKTKRQPPELVGTNLNNRGRGANRLEFDLPLRSPSLPPSYMTGSKGTIQDLLAPRRAHSRSATVSETDSIMIIPDGLSKKDVAAMKLEIRRQSLARRPSAPAIPLPGGGPPPRPDMVRSHTHNEPKDDSNMVQSPVHRSQSADPGNMLKYNGGLPATPRAMKRTEPATEGRPAADNLAPLLPSTVFGQKAVLPRSMSVPLETQQSTSPRSHLRKVTPPEPEMVGRPQRLSIDEALHMDDENVIIIPPTAADAAPTMLPELQHLAVPPPPPPPPSAPGARHSDVIDIVVDSTLPMPIERAATSSPYHTAKHRRGSSSVEARGSRIKGMTDWVRTHRRTGSRTITSPVTADSPRERKGSITRAKSPPYEQAMTSGGPDQTQIAEAFEEVTIPPTSTSRNGSREIWANMPPETLQQGVFNGGLL